MTDPRAGLPILCSRPRAPKPYIARSPFSRRITGLLWAFANNGDHRFSNSCTFDFLPQLFLLFFFFLFTHCHAREPMSSTGDGFHLYSSFTRLWDSLSIKLPRERVLLLRPNLEPELLFEDPPAVQRSTPAMKRHVTAAHMKPKA
jgi:hypothetical protein